MPSCTLLIRGCKCHEQWSCDNDIHHCVCSSRGTYSCHGHKPRRVGIPSCYFTWKFDYGFIGELTCRADNHDCICPQMHISKCISETHRCICNPLNGICYWCHLKHKNTPMTKMCRSTNHDCICKSYRDSKLCIAKDHICSCQYNLELCRLDPNKKHKCSCKWNKKCRMEPHKCMCMNGRNDCEYSPHKCSCYINPDLCKSVNHTCMCDKDKKLCKGIGNHKCLERCKVVHIQTRMIGIYVLSDNSDIPLDMLKEIVRWI